MATTTVTTSNNTTITLSQDDITNATTFLDGFLSSALPAYDFSRGSAIRDMVINSIAYIFAYFQYQIAQSQAGLSVNLVSTMAPGPDQNNAIVDLMSNLFVTPTAGQFSVGYLTLHFSQLTDVVVPTSAIFAATTALTYQLNSDTNLIIPSSQLTPVVNPLGVIQEYTTTIPAIATAIGEAYNIQPTVFLNFTTFNPYLTEVESVNPFQNGAAAQTPQNMLAQAPTAITLRDLVSVRSINTTLTTNFPEIIETVVVAYGDPEMQRDVVPDAANVGQIHNGGCVDVYINSALATNQSFTGTVGGFFVDPRPNITIFTDATFYNPDGTPNGSTFPSNVHVGDVLTIVYNTTHYQYLIQQVFPTFLIVSQMSPFPALAAGLPYAIGSDIIGNYTDKVNNLSSSENGVTTNTMFISGSVALPETPIYFIDQVAELDPTSANANTNGVVIYDYRVNTPVTGFPQYQIYCLNPDEAPSAEQLMLLQIATDNSHDGNQITVTYDTLANFGNIADYTTDPFNRNPDASILVKGLNPVYLSFIVGYSLASNPPVGTPTFVPADAQVALSNYINSFPADETLHVSNIGAFLLATYPALISAYPYVIVGTGNNAIRYNYTMTYDLYAPNGAVYNYQTSDYVVVNSNYATPSAEF